MLASGVTIGGGARGARGARAPRAPSRGMCSPIQNIGPHLSLQCVCIDMPPRKSGAPPSALLKI